MMTTARGPVVGFDLDMTLVDSAAGIAATLQAALAEVGVEIVPEQVWPYNGLPLAATLEGLAPEVDRAVVAVRYRQLYPRLGVGLTTLLPGAVEAFRAVHAHGGRVLVVSTKVEPAVRAVLRQVGLDRGPQVADEQVADEQVADEVASEQVAGEVADEVAGGLFAAEKGVRLATAGAHVYVGDHPGDVEAARCAGAVSVAVPTGPHSAAELTACGAEVVLPDLTVFPQWLAGFEADRTGQEVGGAAGRRSGHRRQGSSSTVVKGYTSRRKDHER
jgi:phosphoglycolate phosphatase